MPGFEKTKLATGEFRGEYIVRRLKEGAGVKDIHAEINAEGLHTGDRPWPASIIYVEQRKMQTKLAKRAPELVDASEPAPVDQKANAVPPEYEEVLTPEDMAEVRKEAADAWRAKQRKQARKDMLARFTTDLEREARIAAQQGSAKGGLIDVTIDIAPYAEDIRLDGISYRHGTTHRVPRNVACVLMEQMQRSWEHEASLHGASDRPYRRTLNQRGVTANNFREGVRA